jgi:hypothetical protein
MARVGDFLHLVIPFAPGVPDPVAEQAVLDGAIRFCRESRALRMELDPILVMPGFREYDVEPDTVEPIEILAAQFDGRNLAAASFEQAKRETPEDPGQPVAWYQVSPRLVRLFPTPIGRGLLHLYAITEPRTNTTQLDDRIYREWRHGVAAAALCHLLLTPNQPYSNAQLAGRYEARFMDEVARAQAFAGKAQLRVRPCT